MADGESDTDSHHVHIAFGIGQWPEDGFEVLGIFADETAAEATADTPDAWHHGYVLTEEVL